MSFYAQYGNTIVLAVVSILVWFYLRGRFDELKQEIVELRRDTDRKFELFMAEFNSVRTEINSVRSDLTNVALAVGARTRPEANPA